MVHTKSQSEAGVSVKVRCVAQSIVNQYESYGYFLVPPVPVENDEKLRQLECIYLQQVRVVLRTGDTPECNAAAAPPLQFPGLLNLKTCTTYSHITREEIRAYLHSP